MAIGKNNKSGIVSPDLIQPGDENYENVLNTEQGPEASTLPGIELNTTLVPERGVQLKNIDHSSYTKYIDRPFSYISDDPDDLRAYNQSTGEKIAYGLPKFVTRVGTNVLGSTVGLVYGGVSFLGGLFDEEVNATKAFFDNDFQRGMDGINDWMDGALPHYYTKEEQDYNFWQSMGTANFWANDFSQGLSFVAGAVLSEYLTAGLATSALAARGANLMRKMGKGMGLGGKTKYAGAGTTSDDILKQADDLFTKKKLGAMGKTMRQLGTGAMYEAGVEARHHYDATMNNLERAFEDEYGRSPNSEEMGYLVDIATKSANAVFGANVALVGYGNYMMFPKIFGKGFNATKNSLRKQVGVEIKDNVAKWKALYKDMGKREALGRNAWRVLKTPLYEGFVEEGGQKLADLSGQHAADYYYRMKEDPTMMGMVGELLNSTDDAFAEAYGSKEGQKEIGIGFLLAAMGLPGVGVKTDKKGDPIKDKLGKTKTGFKWQGGVYGTIQDMKFEKKMIDAHVNRMNKDKNLIEALNNAKDALVREGVIQDEKDFSQLVNSPFGYKNAEHDSMFNYIYTRVAAGHESHVLDQINMIRNMSVEEFREAFNWNEAGDLSNAELSEKQGQLADMLEERVADVKQMYNKVNSSFMNYDTGVKEAITHALSVGKDSDAREEAIYKKIKEILGFDPEAEMEHDSRSIRDEREEISLRQRIKGLWNRMTDTQKKKVLALPESKSIMRRVGLNAFTDPTHLEELVLELMNERTRIYNEIQELEKDEVVPKQAHYDKESGKNIGGTTKQQEKWAKLENLNTQYEEINKKTEDLLDAINKGLDPDISRAEQEQIDKYKEADPTGYAQNKEELLQLFKDGRKLRARRHRAIAMVNELMDYRDYVEQPGSLMSQMLKGPFQKATPGKKVKQPKLLSPRLIRNVAAENAENITDYNLKRLYTKYQGKIVEFEYTQADKTTVEGLKQIAENAGIGESITNKVLELMDANPKLDEMTAYKTALKTAGINTNDGPKTGTYRFYVKPTKVNGNQDNVLIAYPSQENVELLLERQELVKLPKNKAAQARIEEIDSILNGQGFITDFTVKNLGFLSAGTNIREVTESAQIAEIIDAATTTSREDIQNELNNVNTQIDKFTKDLEKLAVELAEKSESNTKLNKKTKKNLAKDIFNVTSEYSAIQEALANLEVKKVQLETKLKDLIKLNEAVLGAEELSAELTNLSPVEREIAINNAVQERLTEYLKDRWKDQSQILKDFVEKGFFNDIDYLSETFRNEEDAERIAKLADMLFDFANTYSELPAELVSLLGEGMTDIKDRLDAANGLVQKLRQQIHFVKTGAPGQEGPEHYDHRFRNKDEQSRRAAFESVINDIHELTAKYEAAKEELRNKLRVDLAPIFDEINKQADISGRYGAVNNTFIANYRGVMEEIKRLITPPVDYELPNNEIRTNEGEMTEEEIEKDITASEKAYYNSPSISKVKLAKTAGNHKEALKRFDELKEIAEKRKLTKAEQEQFDHYRDQLVFYDWVSRTDKMKDHYSLVPLTRKSIIEFDAQQQNSEDKIASLVSFYDHNKSKPNTARYSKAVNKEGKQSKFSTVATREENLEDIVLVVVDHTGTPIKHEGNIVYSHMMGTEAYRTEEDSKGKPQQVYRFGQRDLVKIDGTVPGFTKTINGRKRRFFTGQMTEEAKKILQQHKTWRNAILEQEPIIYLGISGKSHGMQTYGEQGLEHKGFARETIVQREQDVKDIDLHISRNPNTNVVSIGQRQYNVKAGFFYAIKDGNMVRFKTNKLPKNVQLNVYNSLRLFAKQIEDNKNGTFEGESPYLYPDTNVSIVKQLSDLIYFGKHAKQRKTDQYSIYTEGDVLYYGSNSMTFAQLVNKEGHPELHGELQNFLSELFVQVNGANLYAREKHDDQDSQAVGDSAVRQDNKKKIQKWYLSQASANKKIAAAKKKIGKRQKGQTYAAYNKALYAAARLTRNEKLALKSAKPSPVYNEYIYHEVDSNLNVKKQAWDNYTHFLMGSKSKDGNSRTVHEIPVTVNMVRDTYNENVPTNTYENPQFQGQYLVFNSNSRGADFSTLSEPKSTPKHRREDVNTLELGDGAVIDNADPINKPLEGKAPSGIMEGKEYVYTIPNGTKLQFIVDSISHDNSLIDFTPVSLTNQAGEDISEQLTMEIINTFRSYIYNKDAMKSIVPVKQEKYENEEERKNEGNTTDLKDIKKQKRERKNTTNEDIDGGASMRTSTISMINEEYEFMDFNEEYTKFLEIVPKDKNGNPIFKVSIVEGLVHGRDFGYFTNTGEILLSNEAVRGALYHETFHGIAYKLLSPQERAELYNEVRSIRGKQKTYKGELKELKNFTDIEADEWLAEEFRQYMLNDGAYTIGSNVEKSLIQRLFDFLLQFFKNLQQTKTVFDRIHSGYYGHGVEEYVQYDIAEALQGRGGASMSAYRAVSGIKRDLNNGMTVALFDKIHQADDFGIEEIFELASQPDQLEMALAQYYGVPGDHGKRETVASLMINQVRTNFNAVYDLYEKETDPKKIQQLEKELDNLESIETVIREEWSELIQNNITYLKQFKLNLKPESVEEQVEELNLEDNDSSKDSLSYKPANQVDLKKTVKPSMKLLLGTLPQSVETESGEYVLKTNKAGTYVLAPASQIITTLYKNLANQPSVDHMVDKLQELARENKTYSILLKRLGIQDGIEAVTKDSYSQNQLRMLLGFLKMVNNSNEEFGTLLARKQTSREENPGRFINNSNIEKAENITKNRWNYNFKKRLSNTKLGKTLPDGRRVLDINAKFKIGDRVGSFKEFAQAGLDLGDMIPLLGVLGIEFLGVDKILTKIENGEINDFLDIANWIVGDVIKNEGDVSTIFGGDVEGNLKTLIGYEVDNSTLAITLQHVNPQGKQVYGINRKHYINILADKLNSDPFEIEEMMDNNPFLFGTLFYEEPTINIKTLEGGRNMTNTRGFDISRTTKGNIAGVHIASILDGYVPLIRAGNKKTERAIKIGSNKYRSEEGMMAWATDLLKSEILTANYIKNNPEVQQIPQLREKGIQLQFFSDAALFPVINTGVKAYINDQTLDQDNKKLNDFIESDEVQKEIQALILNRHRQALDFIKKYGLVTKGKNTDYNNIAIDDVHIQRAYQSLPTKEKIKASTKNGQISRSVIEALAKHIGNTQLIGVVEQSRLFLGHPALYKDLFKRTSGLVGTKVYPAFNESILEALNDKFPSVSMMTDNVTLTPHTHRPIMRMVTRAEYSKPSEYMDLYRNRLKEMERPDVLDSVESKFGNMDIFDGGGFITLDSYRSIRLMTDNWTNKDERAYQKIVSNQPLMPGEVVAFSPLKPQVFADINVGGMGLKTFNKFALFPIHPNLSRLVGFEGQRTVMDDIYDDMLKNDIDYMVFESAVKVGAKQNSKNQFEPLIDPETGAAIPLSNDPTYIQEIPLEYFGVQLDPSENKTKVRVGTQSATMLFMNTFSQGFLNREQYSEDFLQLEENYQNVHRAMIDKDIVKLADKLGFIKTPDGFEATKTSKEKMLKALDFEMNKRDLPEHMRDAIHSLFGSELSYTNLLGDKQKIDDLLYSIVTNSVIARKINGDMSTLQADLGFTLKVATDEQLDQPGYRPLKFYEFEKDGKTVTAMEVYLPHHLRSEFGAEVDINDFTEAAKEIIGFRIPTEGLNSVEYIKIAGFLKPSMGTSIIVPHEMVAKSGADYDIDKLTLYLPHIERNEDGTVDLVKPVTNPVELAERDGASFRAAALELFGTDVEGAKTFFKEYKKADEAGKKQLANGLYELGWDNLPEAFKQPEKVVENMLLTSMREVLKHEASFPQLISPVGAFTLSDIAHEIHRDQVNAGITGARKEPGTLLEKLSIDSLVETTYQMHQTLGGTGIVATSLTDLAKSQRSGFAFNLEGQPDVLLTDVKGEKYTLNFEGLENQPIQLGRVFDTEGNLINYAMQQYVSAYVDGEKDPFAMYVNAGQQGAAVHMLLIRAGVPLPTVLKFMAQPVIQEYFMLKNLQSVSNEQSLFKQPLTEKDVREKIRKVVGQPKGAAAFNEASLDKHEIVNGEAVRSGASMLVTKLENMSGGQKQLQAQIFEDFLRYKEYGELLRKAQTLASVDTSKLQNGYSLIYLTALDTYLTKKGAFNNVNAKTSPLTVGTDAAAAPFLSSLKTIYDQSPQLFKETDFKENVVFNKGPEESNPIKQQMILMAQNMIEDGVSQREILYKLRSFDNFLTSWIWSTVRNNELVQLNERIEELFQGPTSLPRRISEAQEMYPDNILLRDMLPVLQEFVESGSQDYSIDKLQLMNKKYTSDEVQDLADAWYELYHSSGKAQLLAEDLIIFSLLKSGTDFHPSSFFHILPGIEIMKATSPMVQRIHDAIHSVGSGRELFDYAKVAEIHKEWLANSWDNPRIVKQIFDNNNRFKTREFSTTEFTDEFITIKSIRDISDRKGIVGPENRYFAATFRRIGFDEESGEAQYQMINQKGILGHLKEIDTGISSIVESNNYPFGRQIVKLPTKKLNNLLEKKANWLAFPMDINNKDMVREGVITTPTGIDIQLERVFHTSIKDLYSNFNYIKFGVKNRAELQKHIAESSGYSSWGAFAKDNKSFMDGKQRLQFFDATILRVAPTQAVAQNDKTEAPVTQSLKSLQPGYNEKQCE